MKINITIFLLFWTIYNAKGQILLETPDGTEITNQVNGSGNAFTKVLASGSFNKDNSVIQLRTNLVFVSDNVVLNSNYLSISLKAKSTNGIAQFFNAGVITPNTSFNATYGFKNFFDKKVNSLVDFGSISLGYEIAEYRFFKEDTAFVEQLTKKKFGGMNLFYTHNFFLSGKHLLSTSIGLINRKNNISDLDDVEVKNSKIFTNNNVTRTVSEVITAKTGNYIEYNSMPVTFSYTFCPSENVAVKDKLLVGVNFYLSTNIIPKNPTNLGCVLFLTQAENSGIRIPLIGLTAQFSDLTDINKKNLPPEKKLKIGITTVIKIGGNG